MLKVYFLKLIRYIFCIYKERLQKEAREKYQNLSEEEKDKRQKKGSRKTSKCY